MELDYVIYLLNLEEKTASIIGYNQFIPNVGKHNIPRSINHNSDEYIITRVCDGVFKHSELRIIEKETFTYSSFYEIIILKHVTDIGDRAFYRCYSLRRIGIYPKTSELRSIGTEAFSWTHLFGHLITKYLIDLKEGWLRNNEYFLKVIVEPSNPRYKIYEDQLLIAKSSMDSDIYDSLILYFREAVNVKIPNFIKKIESYAFENCEKIQSLEISNDSQLESIGRRIFNKSSIECFTITKNLLINKEECFYGASKLSRINDDPKNPKYKLLQDKIIISKSSIESKNYYILVTVLNDVKYVTIPISIKKIEPCAFMNCSELQTVFIPINSELEVIDANAFKLSKFKKIVFSPHIRCIKEKAFRKAVYLESIEIPNNSKLEIIEKYAFSKSGIECFKVPPSLKEIDNHAFQDCGFKYIEIPENSQIKKLAMKHFVNLILKCLKYHLF